MRLYTQDPFISYMFSLITQDLHVQIIKTSIVRKVQFEPNYYQPDLSVISV